MGGTGGGGDNRELGSVNRADSPIPKPFPGCVSLGGDESFQCVPGARCDSPRGGGHSPDPAWRKGRMCGKGGT